MNTAPKSRNFLVNKPLSTNVWGLPLVLCSFENVLDRVEELVQHRTPSFFITANLHYAMLTSENLQLQRVNQNAAFIVADGMPLVWASHLTDHPVPTRIAGADLLPALCFRAAKKGLRIFFLGGGPGIAEKITADLKQEFPEINIVGILAPLFHHLNGSSKNEVISKIKKANPDILFVSLTMPNGEIWLSENYETLGVPVCVNVGAAFDFMAGNVKRAPRFFRVIGLEWFIRMCREPLRLIPRYFKNGVFALRMLAKDFRHLISFKKTH